MPDLSLNSLERRATERGCQGGGLVSGHLDQGHGGLRLRELGKLPGGIILRSMLQFHLSRKASRLTLPYGQMLRKGVEMLKTDST
jgi:hypothetical protein